MWPQDAARQAQRAALKVHMAMECTMELDPTQVLAGRESLNDPALV